MSIPYIDLGGEGQELHFAHANGFHPLSYQKFLKPIISKYHVEASLFKPFWPDSDPSDLSSWTQMAEHLIKYSEERGQKKLIGIGHSMGCIISLMAQLKKPELFSKLVLIEPVVLPTHYYWGQKLPLFIKKKVNPVAKIALRRKDKWKSKEQAYEYLRPKKVFVNIPDDAFADYINHSIIDDPAGGVKLAYSKEWEAQVYCTAPNPWRAIKSIKIPTMVVRGAKTDVISPDTWAQWKDIKPNFNFIDVELSGHLVPFERAEALSKIVLSFLES